MGRRKGSKNKPKTTNVTGSVQENPQLDPGNGKKRRKTSKEHFVTIGGDQSKDDSEIMANRVISTIVPLSTAQPSMNVSENENMPVFTFFPPLPDLKPSEQGIERFESLVRIVLSLIRQANTLLSFVHRAEVDSIVKHVISLYRMDDVSEQSDSDSDIEEQDRKLQQQMLYLSQILKFVQTRIIHHKRIQDLFVLDFSSIGLNAIIPSVVSSQGTHSIAETEEQCRLLFSYYIKASPEGKEKFCERFEQLRQILIHFKSVL